MHPEQTTSATEDQTRVSIEQTFSRRTLHLHNRRNPRKGPGQKHCALVTMQDRNENNIGGYAKLKMVFQTYVSIVKTLIILVFQLAGPT